MIITLRNTRCLAILMVCLNADANPISQRLAFLQSTRQSPSMNTSTTAMAKSHVPTPTSTTSTTSSDTDINNSASMASVASNSSKSDIDPRREISISKTISVPFSPTVAVDEFSDWPRQADFSPFLHKVEYVIPPGMHPDDVDKYWGETRWHMRFRGLSFSWTAICTKLDRPGGRIEWESTSGMKNFGKVIFEPLVDDHAASAAAAAADNTVTGTAIGSRSGETHAKITFCMTFVAPRVVASLFRRSNALANFVQDRMISDTLNNFRNVIAAERSRQQQQLQQPGVAGDVE